MLFRVRFATLEERSLGVHLRGQFYLPQNDGLIVTVVRDTKVVVKSDWKRTHIKTSASQPREVVVRSNDDDRPAFVHDRNRFGMWNTRVGRAVRFMMSSSVSVIRSPRKLRMPIWSNAIHSELFPVRRSASGIPTRSRMVISSICLSTTGVTTSGQMRNAATMVATFAILLLYFSSSN